MFGIFVLPFKRKIRGDSSQGDLRGNIQWKDLWSLEWRWIIANLKGRFKIRCLHRKCDRRGC